MDPLSVSASIVALLQLSGKIITYLSDIRDAPTQLQQLRREISSVLSVLILLQEQAGQASQDDTYSNSSLRSLGSPYGPLEILRSALERIASKLAPVEGWRKLGKTFKWPFDKKEVVELLQTIERQKSILSLARQNDHIAISRAIENGVGNLRQAVDNIDVKLSSTQITGIHQKLRDWLSPPDPSTNYNKARKLHCGSTGEWLFENDAYKAWLAGPRRIIWLWGIPGCGKTILCSTIIQTLEASCRLQDSSALLYFYFDFNDAEKQKLDPLIRSLVVQISTLRPELTSSLRSLYVSFASGGRQPSCDLLMTVLREIIERFENTYIVLDALDECSELEEILSVLEDLIGWENTNIHLLVSSRRIKAIEDSLEPLCKDESMVCVQKQKVNDDISVYIRNELQNDRRLKKWQNMPGIHQEIENSLMSKADGMFRWVACQLDSLKSCLNLQMLRKALRSLPRTLNATYARILSDISEEYRYSALQVLRWLTHSLRPLVMEEISEVVAVDTREELRFDQNRRLLDPRDLLLICPSLIAFEEAPDFKGTSSSHLDYDNSSRDYAGRGKTAVKLAHFSVKEYLLSSEIQQGDTVFYALETVSTHQSMSNDCIAYLLHFDDVKSLNTEFLQKYPLALYAARNWINHARLALKNEQFDSSLIMALLRTNGSSLLNWIRLWDPDAPWQPHLERDSGHLSPPLYYASGAGLYPVVQELWKHGADINAPGGVYHDALQVASFWGREETVKVLLDRGADVNLPNGPYSIHGSALQAASYRGHEKIVRLLLEYGADVNASEGYNGTALQASTNTGYKAIMQILIEGGADVNKRSSSQAATALQNAVKQGRREMVQMLLDGGAEPNRFKSGYNSPLTRAVQKNDEEMVRMLLEKKANAKVTTQDGKSLLHIASTANIARMLLDHGAGVKSTEEPKNSSK